MLVLMSVLLSVVVVVLLLSCVGVYSLMCSIVLIISCQAYTEEPVVRNQKVRDTLIY